MYNMDMVNEHLYNEVLDEDYNNEVLDEEYNNEEYDNKEYNDEEYNNEVMYNKVVNTFISALYVDIPDELPDQYQKRFLTYLETYVNDKTHKYNINYTIFLFIALTFCDIDDAERLIKQYGQNNTVPRIALKYACKNPHMDVEFYVYTKLVEPLRVCDMETIILFSEPTLNLCKMFMSKQENIYLCENYHYFWSLLVISAKKYRVDIFQYLMDEYELNTKSF